MLLLPRTTSQGGKPLLKDPTAVVIYGSRKGNARLIGLLLLMYHNIGLFVIQR